MSDTPDVHYRDEFGIVCGATVTPETVSVTSAQGTTCEDCRYKLGTDVPSLSTLEDAGYPYNPYADPVTWETLARFLMPGTPDVDAEAVRRDALAAEIARFRAEAARTFDKVAEDLVRLLSAWYALPGDVEPISAEAGEYPFPLSLDDFIAEVQHAADQIRNHDETEEQGR